VTPQHRIFIAVELAPALHQAVVDTQQRLEAAGAKVRWIKPDHLHFTLRFLGEVSPAQVALAKIATREAVEGLHPFTIVLQSLGAFPSFQRPQVVWIGVTEGAQELETLAARVDARVLHHRLPPADHPFRPHLTLARIRDARQWGDVVRALMRDRDAAVGSQEVQAVAVMESRLTPKGPVYTRVEEVSLPDHEK
jgi:2'-5' RNA ligase